MIVNVCLPLRKTIVYQSSMNNLTNRRLRRCPNNDSDEKLRYLLSLFGEDNIKRLIITCHSHYYDSKMLHFLFCSSSRCHVYYQASWNWFTIHSSYFYFYIFAISAFTYADMTSGYGVKKGCMNLHARIGLTDFQVSRPKEEHMDGQPENVIPSVMPSPVLKRKK